MKKIISLMLCGVCILSVMAGCGKDPQSSVPASSDSSATSSAQTESTISTLSLPAPQIDPAVAITASQVIPDSAKTFTVDTELRGKYFDYFAPTYSFLMPKEDFTSPEELSNDDIVRFAIKCAAPLAYTSETGLAIYTYEDVQYTALKYLGVQVDDLNEVDTYGFDPTTYHFIDTARFGAFYYFYRLEELSVDADGVYTGVFNVYQKAFASPENYNEALSDVRGDIIGDSVNTASYKEFSTITLRFVEMRESDGSSYYRYLSLSTVKK